MRLRYNNRTIAEYLMRKFSVTYLLWWRCTDWPVMRGLVHRNLPLRPPSVTLWMRAGEWLH